MKYAIVFARPSDLTRIAAIELAAAQLLRGHAPDTVLAEVTSLSVLEAARRDGRVWVATADDEVVAFAHVERIEPDAAHLEELDVHPDHGRRGLGTRLVRAVCAWAESRGCLVVTLCTFRDVPWNMPFYAKLGFEVVAPDELSPGLQAIVADEAQRGLDPARRVVMRWRASSSVDRPMNP